MEKRIAILNGKEVKEIKNPHVSFEELLEGQSPNEIRVVSENGKTRIASLEDKIADYLETRKVEIGGLPRKYQCLELELKQKLNFDEYCKKTSCLIIDRQIFELSKNREKGAGKLELLGQTFYITEKNPTVEIEFDEDILHELMTRNYFNYRGSLYELKEGEGEIELKGRQYKITDRKRGGLTAPEILPTRELSNRIKEYEVKYRETREVIIRRKYRK